MLLEPSNQATSDDKRFGTAMILSTSGAWKPRLSWPLAPEHVEFGDGCAFVIPENPEPSSEMMNLFSESESLLNASKATDAEVHANQVQHTDSQIPFANLI